jgi:hypothetical protein
LDAHHFWGSQSKAAKPLHFSDTPPGNIETHGKVYYAIPGDVGYDRQYLPSGGWQTYMTAKLACQISLAILWVDRGICRTASVFLFINFSRNLSYIFVSHAAPDLSKVSLRVPLATGVGYPKW